MSVMYARRSTNGTVQNDVSRPPTTTTTLTHHTDRRADTVTGAWVGGAAVNGPSTGGPSTSTCGERFAPRPRHHQTTAIDPAPTRAKRAGIRWQVMHRAKRT